MKVFLILVFIAAAGAHLRDHAKQKYIGTAISPDHFSDAQYKKVAAEEFNCVTAEWQMKWDPIGNNKGHPDYSLAEPMMQFAKEHNMKVRGHALVWHTAVPKWVEALKNNKAELETAMKQHITQVTQHFKGRVYCWDVVNEVIEDDGSMRQSIWYKNFGTKFISEAFHLAHTNDPNAKLYINDYSVEGKNKKSDALYNLVKKLKSEGVPIQGVGFQAHFQINDVPKDFASNMQRFADLGVDVAITELDIRMPIPATPAHLEQQAKDYEHVFKACQSVHRCVGVTVWGYSDKYSWVPSVFKGFGASNLFDANYKPKPAVNAIQKVLQ